jgi:hypothetical protein
VNNRLTQAIEKRKQARLAREADARRQAEERAAAERREAESRRLRAEAKEIATAWDRGSVDMEAADPFWDELRRQANNNVGEILKMTEEGDSVTLGSGKRELRFTRQGRTVKVTNNGKNFGTFGPGVGDGDWAEDPAILALSDRGFEAVRAAFEAFVIATADAIPTPREVS